MRSHLTKPKIAAQVPPHWRRRSRKIKLLTPQTQSSFNHQQLATQILFHLLKSHLSTWSKFHSTTSDKEVVPTPRCDLPFPLREKPLILSHLQEKRERFYDSHFASYSYLITSNHITSPWLPRQQISQRSNWMLKHRELKMGYVGRYLSRNAPASWAYRQAPSLFCCVVQSFLEPV